MLLACMCGVYGRSMALPRLLISFLSVGIFCLTAEAKYFSRCRSAGQVARLQIQTQIENQNAEREKEKCACYIGKSSKRKSSAITIRLERGRGLELARIGC